MTRSRPGQLRLGRTTRRLVFLAHVILALGWLGVDVVIGVFTVTGFTSHDPNRVATSYLALETFAVPLLLMFGVGALGTGLLLTLASGWGVVRYWWVTVKLVINLLLSSLVLILLRPRVAAAAEQAARVDAMLRGWLGAVAWESAVPGIRVGGRVARGGADRRVQALGPYALGIA